MIFIILFTGPPIIADLTVLNNKTSTVAPLSWFIVTDGGYAPLTFTVYKKMFLDAEFSVVSDNIQNYVSEGKTINFDVVELLPATQYEFKVRAKNDIAENSFSGNISGSGDTKRELTAFLMYIFST